VRRLTFVAVVPVQIVVDLDTCRVVSANVYEEIVNVRDLEGTPEDIELAVEIADDDDQWKSFEPT
jgi:hypothetical protein